MGNESCFENESACAPGLCCGEVFGRVDDNPEDYTLCWYADREWCDTTFEEETDCEWGYDFTPLTCTEERELHLKTGENDMVGEDNDDGAVRLGFTALSIAAISI